MEFFEFTLQSAKWSPSRAWRAYSVALLLAITTLGLKYLLPLFKTFENVTSVTWNLSVIVEAANILVGFFCRSVRLHQRLWKILNSKVTRTGVARAAALPAGALLVARVGGYLVVFMKYILRKSTFLVYLSVITLFVSHVIESTETFLFVYLIDCASEVFQEVRDNVLELADRSPTADDIVRLRERYEEAVDFAKCLGACFGPQKLLVCFKDCWELISTVFVLVSALLRSERLSIQACVSVAAFLLAYMILLLSAERVAYQAKTVLPAVHFILCTTRTLSDRERKELIIFSKHIKQNPAYISLGGVVTLNTKLFFEVCLGSASYLVILLQFQSSEFQCEDVLLSRQNITNASLSGMD